ncbi:MAG: CTP-dependent riboflavin kinase [Candidatus Bathyarchaeota archaeon]|nr:CTP-dependent riboflavin kinase [Candidatus Bathyarchaeota archaeon]
MTQITVEGTVYSGKGEGKRFVGLPWVKQQIQQKLGFVPYDGTLNLRLTEAGIEKRRLIEQAEGVLVVPQSGFCPGVLYRAQIGNQACAVVIPQVAAYPKDVLEVIAAVCLREKFGLVDGSVVSVTVSV